MDREREIKAEHKKKKRIVMEKGTTVQGVITIERAYIIPIIFILFATIVYTVFFYHDKNILIGAAGETAVTAAQTARKPEVKNKEEISEFYQNRVRGKLILFPDTEVSIEETNQRIRVCVHAQRGKMHLQVKQSAAIVTPEKTIRRKQLLEGAKSHIENEE